LKDLFPRLLLRERRSGVYNEEDITFNNLQSVTLGVERFLFMKLHLILNQSQILPVCDWQVKTENYFILVVRGCNLEAVK